MQPKIREIETKFDGINDQFALIVLDIDAGMFDDTRGESEIDGGEF